MLLAKWVHQTQKGYGSWCLLGLQYWKTQKEATISYMMQRLGCLVPYSVIDCMFRHNKFNVVKTRCVYRFNAELRVISILIISMKNVWVVVSHHALTFIAIRQRRAEPWPTNLSWATGSCGLTSPCSLISQSWYCQKVIICSTIHNSIISIKISHFSFLIGPNY